MPRLLPTAFVQNLRPRGLRRCAQTNRSDPKGSGRGVQRISPQITANHKPKTPNQLGFALVEALVALAIVGVIFIVGIFWVAPKWSDRHKNEASLDQSQQSTAQIKPSAPEEKTGLQFIKIQTSLGEVETLYQHPEPGKKLPAVIYNHGKLVEVQGYEGAKRAGYDVADFVKALASEGFVALAPIRKGEESGNEIIAAAENFLKEQSDSDLERIFLVGFSRGGVLSLQYALNHNSVKGVVLLAPAIAGPDIFEELSDGLDTLSAPIFVALGAEEPNPAIKNFVPKLVKKLEMHKKKVTAKLNYPGDHQWFYQTRQEYWQDVISFLKENSK